MVWPQIPTELLRHIQENLQSSGATFTTAESCTGGLVGAMMTELPGSSAVYLGGVVAYANAVKVDLLGVRGADLERFGAVSAEVASAMAQGAAERLGSTFALALTGVAGPGGGSVEKPVGTVYCAVSGPLGCTASRLTFSGDRSQIRAAAATRGLELLAQGIADWREQRR